MQKYRVHVLQLQNIIFNDKLFSLILLLSEEPPKPIIEPVPVPHSVGEEAAAIMPPSQGFLSNISYTNLKTEINNMR